jgi:hypothetical protein
VVDKIAGQPAPATRIDHLVIDVGKKIDAAETTFRNLGFHLTDRGRHSLGSVNHLAVFDGHYLELLGLPDNASLQRPEIAEFPVGLNGLVFAADDPQRLHAELLARKVPAQHPEPLSRPVKLPSGTADARFEVVRLAPGSSSLGRVYFCHHITPELVWRAEVQHHRNGVFAISRIRVASEDPAKSATLLGGILGEPPPSDTSDGSSDVSRTVRADQISIDFLSLPVADPDLRNVWPESHGRRDYMAILTFRTKSLTQVSDALKGGSIPTMVADRDRILVAAHDACNVGLEFIEG